MPWLPLSLIAESVTPVASATGDIVSYILGYGVLGVGAVLLVLRILVPGKTVDEAVERARTDLLKEVDRLREEKEKAEEQRDEALKFAQIQLVPLLTSFTATTTALLPLLQELVRVREVGRRDDDERNPGTR